MANHWSKDMATLWWRDAGTLRMRVSFHRDPAKLLRKFAKLCHDKIDAALYDKDGMRLPLRVPDDDEPKRKRKPAKRPAKKPAAALVAA